ncbi:MAG: tetratricopeptide repeat protein [Lachnospiraceae bacterium]|nr:tetratricopeptide repeat protein [Lachnospiraceae bacterium]
MNCPKCGAPVPSKKQYCDVCGAELTVYRRILRLSNYYYNCGLEKAKVRNLSGAITDLKRSLEINKKNINARNLLGLVLFETGEVVAALSEWVISKNFKDDDNDADYFLSKVQDNSVELDSMNQAIRKYNQALESVREYSDARNADMAIVQLKKAVSMNPRMLKALQLLALLYIREGDYEKAMKVLEQARNIDVSNPMTLRYIAHIDEETKDYEQLSKKEKAERILMAPDAEGRRVIGFAGSYHEDKPNIMVFFNLFIGVLIGIAVVYYLIVPTKESKIRQEYESQKIDYSAELSTKNATITQQERSIANLEKQIRELESSLDEEPDTPAVVSTNSSSYNKLFEVWGKYKKLKSDEYDDDELVAFALELTEVDENGLDNDVAIELLSEIRNEIYPLASRKVYRSGRNSFDDGDYAESSRLLEAAVKLSPDNDAAMYYLGKSYQALKDNEKAIYYYKLMLEVCPNSTLKEYIPQRLSECGYTEKTTE